MIAAFILVLSVVAVIEFAIAQWRSMWIAASSQPLSEGFQTATGIAPEAIRAEHFELLTHTSQRLPFASGQERNAWLREVRLYYRMIQALDGLCAKSLPAASNWAKGELVACARYAAAVLDQRLNANLEYAADVRSF
jgi:hypothetical protein